MFEQGNFFLICFLSFQQYFFFSNIYINQALNEVVREENSSQVLIKVLIFQIHNVSFLHHRHILLYILKLKRYMLYKVFETSNKTRTKTFIN